MTYATEALTKRRCGIQANDTKADVEIGQAMTFGDAWVDTKLGAAGVSTGGSDQILVEIACDMAAYYYHRNHGNTALAQMYKEMADEAIVDYVTGQYGSAVERSRGPPHIPPEVE